ncbi:MULTISPECIES: non-canonical purine NTP diphosphatase [Flavobacteriaceae]|uniref:dITP/XTP pyrophosphatase n=2 Tax=Flavobacteriaceae TaxID=49546 RepID=A0A4Y8AYI1_9FLAO|nr:MULTISPECIES: non-canonical purine NTP diphosphatase [Flavobacteriaceae]TEW76928.1 non-canonical purine NTP diphosphatase [Gramella jeungdoensis]GGK59249.1 non-canonical purine NTP pyrophosphatase [Lutibacter litoralis]
MNKLKLVFATNNKNKLKEVRAMLTNFEIVSLADINCFDDIPETADTLEGNAILKANYITKKYGLNCFADDTGLEVEALNNQPGVYSARYAGEENNSEKNMSKLLTELGDNLNRNAQFKTVIALNINKKQFIFDGICKGQILKEKQGISGFGYDPIFMPKGYNKSFAEMDLKEKGTISHRGKAIQQLVHFLKNHF